MKKLLTATVLALTLATGFVVQAQEVYSNTVGIIKLSVEKGSFSLIHCPFDKEGATDQTVKDVFGDTLPAGTQVLAWNKDLQKYETSTYAPVFGGWSPSTLVLNRGIGFFVSIPESAPEDNYDVVLSGNVPNESSKDVVVVPGFQFLGFPYPVGTKISEMKLGVEAQAGDVVYVWSGASGWQSSTFAPVFGGWTPDLTLEPGVAFMYSAAANRTSTEIQPYNLD